MNVASELEIRNVLAKLAHLADTGDTAAYVDLLTDDVVWDVPANPATGLAASRRAGRDDVAAGQRERIAAGLQGPGSGTLHLVTTIAVDVHGDDDAVASSYFVFLRSTAAVPTIAAAGRYDDALRRTDAGWKLAHRTITFG